MLEPLPQGEVLLVVRDRPRAPPEQRLQPLGRLGREELVQPLEVALQQAQLDHPVEPLLVRDRRDLEELELLARVALARRGPRHAEELRERRVVVTRPPLQPRELGELVPEVVEEQPPKPHQLLGDPRPPLERV
ncbi:hypothetical protein DEH18_34555 [Streptomyces sp. NHF165]|nr:hypothetical protein DEH18_34555 [Streptomyces sp. NHF165]